MRLVAIVLRRHDKFDYKKALNICCPSKLQGRKLSQRDKDEIAVCRESLGVRACERSSHEMCGAVVSAGKPDGTVTSHRSRLDIRQHDHNDNIGE